MMNKWWIGGLLVALMSISLACGVETEESGAEAPAEVALSPEMTAVHGAGTYVVTVEGMSCMKYCGTKVKRSFEKEIKGAEDVAIDLEAKTATVTVGEGGEISGALCRKALTGTNYLVTAIARREP